MFELLPVNVDDVVAFKATGKLTDEDYQKLIPVLENQIREHGKVSLYVELEDFKGWEPKAAWDDLAFGLKHDEDFRRIAIVGDNVLEKEAIALVSLFTQSEMRFFKQADADKAWEWLRNKPEVKPVEAAAPYESVVLATDFSQPAEHAAQRTKELCTQYGASLKVVHVVEPFILYPEDYDPLMPDYSLDDELVLAQAEASMNQFVERTGLKDALGDKLETTVEWGAPKRSIVSLAREQNADLIIVGSHGHKGVERLLGSVSSAVLNKASCDVMVVKK